MMTLLICFAAFLSGAAFTLLIHQKTKRLAGQTAVSRRPEDRFVPSKPLGHLITVSAAIGTISLLCIAVLSLPAWTVAGVAVYHIIVVSYAWKSNQSAAKRGAPSRYLQALRAPVPSTAKIALYFSEPRLLTPYQVTMWLEPLLSLGEPFVILLKERKHMKHFPKNANFDVLVVSDMPASTPFLPPNTEVLFFVNNSMVNLGVIEANPQVTHVQLLHGDSDKPPSYNPMSAVYDKLFVAGEMAIDRYARNGVSIGREKFEIVGRPQLEAHCPSAASDRKTIVYMTTWAGMFEDSNFCSLDQAHDILHQTVTSDLNIDVIFKPHPISMKDANWNTVSSQIDAVMGSLPEGVSFRYAPHDESPFDLYKMADVLITDVSSTLIDYLHTGKPYLVTNPHGFTIQDIEKHPSINGGGLLKQDCSNMQELLRDALGQDQLKETRLALRSYAFGDYGRPQGEAFREACEALLKPVANKDASKMSSIDR